MVPPEPIDFRDGVWSVGGIEFVALDVIDDGLALVGFRLHAELISGERWLDVSNSFEIGSVEARQLIECFGAMYSSPRQRGDKAAWTSIWLDFQIEIHAIDGRGHFGVQASFSYPPNDPFRAGQVSLCVPIETEGLNQAAVGLRRFFGGWINV